MIVDGEFSMSSESGDTQGFTTTCTLVESPGASKAEVGPNNGRGAVSSSNGLLKPESCHAIASDSWPLTNQKKKQPIVFNDHLGLVVVILFTRRPVPVIQI
jgi:hypothetical protein